MASIFSSKLKLKDTKTLIKCLQNQGFDAEIADVYVIHSNNWYFGVYFSLSKERFSIVPSKPFLSIIIIIIIIMQ